jgi:hypothetical protein
VSQVDPEGHTTYRQTQKGHECLGRIINYSKKGKVGITMIDYMNEMLQDLPSDMDEEASTPAANHYFPGKREAN